FDENANPAAIRPPARRAPEHAPPFNAHLTDRASPPVELRVAPKLPGVESAAPRARLSDEASSEGVHMPGASFAVLQLQHGGGVDLVRLPFQPMGKAKHFAVQIPADADATIRDF